MTIGTLIAIILGLVVLVLLIVGFTGGWNNFMEKLNIFGRGESTLSNVEDYCNLACLGTSEAEFCSIKQNLKHEGFTNSTLTCYNLSKISEANGLVVLNKSGQTLNVTIGVDSCPTITC